MLVVIEDEEPAMFEAFSQPARQVVELAREEALLVGASDVGTDHLLLGVLYQAMGVRPGERHVGPAVKFARSYRQGAFASLREAATRPLVGVVPGVRLPERGLAAELLEQMAGTPVDQVRRRVLEATGRPLPDGVQRLSFTDEAQRVLETASDEAEQLGHRVNTDHLLLGLLASVDESDPARRVLTELGLTADIARYFAARMRTPGQLPVDVGAGPTPQG